MRVPAGVQAATGAGRIRGYACVFDNVDLGNDRILRGAFAASLMRRPAGEVRMLFQHDPARPVGRWTTIREDAHGLWVEGVLAPAASARDVAALVAARALDGLSIGFRTVRARRSGGVREIVRADLHEVSIVTFPMNGAAKILSQQEHTE